MKHWLISFESEYVISFAAHGFLRSFTLTAHCVGCDDAAADVRQLQKQRHG